MRRGGFVALAALLASCAGSTGRVPAPSGTRVGALTTDPLSRDELLSDTGAAIWRGDLAAADVALTALADRERGRPDTALDFWSDLLALLRCEPLGRVPQLGRGDPPLVDPWEQLRRLVQIERIRLGRELPAPPKSGRLIARLDAPTGARAVREVAWPVEKERWSDETAVPVLVTRCVPAGETGSVRAGLAPAPDAEVALVVATARAMPPDHPAAAPLLLQAGLLEIVDGRPGPAAAAFAALDAVGGTLDAREHTQAVFAAALAANDDPAVAPELALGRARAAFALDLPAVVRRSLALRLAERLDEAKRSDDAVAILGPPPHGDDAIGRYITFHQVVAHARAGRRAQLLAEAREALHRHGHADVDADPTLGAVMDLALRTLEASPVSTETMEVLEALGPPRERVARAEAFAQMGLSAGAYASAMATFGWLYQNDTDVDRRLQHLARQCVAAARAGAKAEFARTFGELAGQEEEIDSVPGAGAGPAAKAKPTGKATGRANGKSAAKEPARDTGLIASAEAEGHHAKRRAARSTDWQRALLVVARDALPALVENDDQADLATLVATLKRHLDEAGRGPVDEELTTLYRAASAHLKSGPRAYAETVGAERRPILLGDIMIGRSYEVRAPVIDLTPALEEAGPLVFVPRRGTDPSSLRRWPGTFRVVWMGVGS
ncbi:MAG TPA: hypothetical protein VI456_09940 [Polyangia bacterium]